MRTLVRTLVICLLATGVAARAQDKPAVASAPENPYCAFNKRAYSHMKDLLLRSAEKVPEESFAFKPTDSVRSFGQVLGHVVDSEYFFCSAALGEKNPSPKVEETKTTKASLTAALKDVFTYCDKAYDGMTDASGAQLVKLFGQDLAKGSVLAANVMHGMEHYGNMATYMRIKGIVPPSSDRGSPGAAPEPRK